MFNTTGFENTGNGAFALLSNTTGNNNTGTGAFALKNNTTGRRNTADGGGALHRNTTGSDNIALGSSAGVNLTTLNQGSVLTVIDNTALTPIVGTFSNLPDGAIVNLSNNNLQASYEGGDGNNLTLTVVP